MSYIIKELNNGIGTITFNKPEVHNAFDDAAGEEWGEALQWIKNNDDVKVVILRGEGRSFNTGRDVRAMGVRKEGLSHFDFLRTGQEKIKTQVNLHKPSIAAVKGGCIGGGAEIAMACDIRVSSTDLKFSLPEVLYGLNVDQGGSAMAMHLIGPAKTKWLLMSGDRIDAQTAYEWGLVDFLVEPDELDAKCMELAEKILKNPYRAVVASKQLVDEFWAKDVREAIQREYINQLALYGSEDFLELRAKRQASPSKK